jgi:alkylhydroperoxidase family enzyme
MREKTSCLLLSITALAIGSILSAAQTTLEQPGGRQPVALTKPRIAPLSEAHWTDVHRQLVAKFAPDGRADNALKTILHLPELVEGVMPFTLYLSDESSLSPRHRALLALRVAWLCGNQPLWATHATRARKAGLTTSEIRRIAQGPDTSGWDPFEATLLRLADELFRNSSVTDATWQTLSASYDLFHLLDAVETVNHFTVLSMMYNSFGVQPDADMPDRLPRDVPYRVVVPPREPPLTMARVTPNDGRGLAVTRTFARYPQLQTRWSPRQGFVNRTSKLVSRHRELLILRMGWNCRSEYEWAQHVGTVGRAREHGLEPVRIAEGARASSWDDFERTLLRVPDELYLNAMVSDATWRALSDRFDTGLVMSAVVTPSAYRAISMSLNAYGVQLEPNDERFPRVSF